MDRKALKKILENVVSGKDIVSLFLNAGQPPSLIYWALKSFYENPDMGLAQKVVGRFKASPQYLFDRVSDVVERVDRFRETNPYAILNLTYHANAAEIQEHWKQRLKEWHPDKHGDRDASLVMTQRINDAYMTLKTPDARKDYERQYAPFLAIVKDIEAQGRPPRFEKGHGSFLRWRYLIMAVLVVFAGLFVWKMRHRARAYETLAENINNVRSGSAQVKAKSPEEPSAYQRNPEKVQKEDIAHFSEKVLTDAGSHRGPVSGPPQPEAGVKVQDSPSRQEPPPVLVARGKSGFFGMRSGLPVSRGALDFSRDRPSVFVRKGGVHQRYVEGRARLDIQARRIPVQPRKVKLPLSEPKKIVEKYFEYYRRGDYHALLALFDAEAVENGIPVKGSKSSYRTFFRCLKVVRFDFEEKSSRKLGDKFFMDGKYVMEYKKVSGTKRIRDAGQISFVVVKGEKGRHSWLIRDVEYRSK